MVQLYYDHLQSFRLTRRIFFSIKNNECSFLYIANTLVMSFYDTTNPDRRERIMMAALQLFVDKGYFNTSVHEIREKADVSIGLLYRYFKNKEDVAAAMYRELVDETNAVISEIVETHDTAAKRCRAIIAHYLQLTESSPDLIEYTIFIRHREISKDNKMICSAGASDEILRIMREGMEKGEIRRMHPAVARVAVFGGMFRLIQLRLNGMLQVPVTDLLDELWAASWRAVAV